MKTLNRCPACGDTTLVDHCDNPVCTWMHCRGTDCDLTMDVRTKRGHRLGPVDPVKKERRRVNWVAPR
jgi:hypothetical protein